MLLFKKIVAAIFMALSAIAVIALIIALFGSWVVRARLETISIELLLAGENVIAVTQDGLDRVDELLHTSTNTVDEVDATIHSIGEGVEESDPLLDQLLQKIGIDLKQTTENAASAFSQVEANIVAINDAVDAIRSVPLLNIDSRLPTTTKLQEVEGRMVQIREDVTALSDEVENRRSEQIDGKVTVVTDVTADIRDSLHTTRTSLDDANTRLDESSQSMAELREQIPGLYTMITILLNILMLLAILAFVSLFIHSWDYFKCPEDGLSGLMPDDCEKTPAVA